MAGNMETPELTAQQSILAAICINSILQHTGLHSRDNFDSSYRSTSHIDTHPSAILPSRVCQQMLTGQFHGK
jgi:hypothetical protein